jgi:tripartite-type tricarboxylate transporter receptor subunit TctC
MTITRRGLPARLAAPIVASAALAGSALAQPAWPARPVRLVVPFAPGGPADILARMLAEFFTPRLGQPAIVENHAGAGGMIGTRVAATSTDGHTLLLGSVSMTIVPHLATQAVGYDVVADFVPIGLVASAPFVLVVPAASALRDPAGLVAASRVRPLNAGNSGNGTLSHLAIEVFRARAGAAIEAVAYRGEGQMLPDLVAGNIGFSFASLSSALPLIRDGRLRALAVLGPARLEALPAVPTLAEQGVADVEADGWQALFANRTVPRDGVDRLRRLLAEALADPAISARIAGFGLTRAARDPAGFAAMFAEEYRRWGEVVRARGIRAE